MRRSDEDGYTEYVAARLKDTVRGSDVVARLSGDEFVIVLDVCAADADAVIRSHWILRIKCA